jgi:acetylornithine deacetylase/succinyl-diaminopimelate desuccinylase-like protein
MTLSSQATDRLVRRALDLVDVPLAIDLTAQICRIPSVLGEEGAIGRWLLAQMQSLGFDEVVLQEVFPGRANAIGRMQFGDGSGPTFVLTGHMDTKPVCRGWDGDPYAGLVRDDRVYGHGIMDMKAALTCMLAAAKSLRDGPLNTELNGTLYVAAVCDHMGAQAGSIKLFEHIQGDYCILGELSDNEIYLGHRGRYYFDLTTLGRAAHTCHKPLAINANYLAAEFIIDFEPTRYFPTLDAGVASLFGDELFMSAGRIYGGLPPGGPSMIPDECVIRIDTRPQPGISVEEVRGVIQTSLDRVQAHDPQFQYSLELADLKNPHYIAPEQPVVQQLKVALEAATGRPAAYKAASWLGDTASFGHLIPTVIFGPGREPVYTANEYLSFGEIATAAQVYAACVAQALAR